MEDSVYVEDEPMYTEYVEEKPTYNQSKMINPFTFALQLLATYGWYIVGGIALSLYALNKLRPVYKKWQQAREDAEYHKDPDKNRARMEAIQLAREQQQLLLQQASDRALQEQKEREERKRAEAIERLQKYTSEGNRVGTPTDHDYLPLSGGASTSSYRAPKRSKCGGGGCGR